ncbi:cytochrome P450 [Salaquimonas pukyongi]|uniref:cytochrome P450 n=1 Tax=Salaquimonas pukyongi TaxID=2712698 RepID=UPI00096BB8C4|nr:cytochrome P450 [Salaquimonas pukyongi]
MTARTACADLPTFTVSPADDSFCQNPYPVYRQMRDLGPAFFWRDYGHVTFAGYEEVNALLRDRRFGREITHIMAREEAGLPPIPEHLEPFYAFEANSMLEREPPAHTRLRTLVTRAFVSRNIARLTPQIETLANELIEAFPAGEFDLLPSFCEKIPVFVIADLLGVPRDMADQLLEWSHAMVAMYQFNRDRAAEDRAVEAMNAFSAYVQKVAGERRKKPRNDLITALVEARDSGNRLSEQELVTTVILLLNAGHEATVHALGNAIKALLETNMGSDSRFGDPEHLPDQVEELLRFDPPLHLFNRFVLEDCTFAGVRLQQGQSVGLLLGSANRDPRRYPSPDRLDFVRGGKGHVAFGAGIHFCLGAPLARLEISAALPLLFNRLPDLHIIENPVYADRYHFHGLKKLMVAG